MDLEIGECSEAYVKTVITKSIKISALRFISVSRRKTEQIGHKFKYQKWLIWAYKLTSYVNSKKRLRIMSSQQEWRSKPRYTS